MPKFSFICTVYNGEKYLAEAVNSALAQTYKDFELILYDDGSTDHTKNIIDNYASRDKRIRAFYGDRNRGALAVLNESIRRAQGEFILRLDADDFCAPNFLEDALKVQQSANYDMIIFGNSMFIDKDKKPLRMQPVLKDTFAYFGNDCCQLFLPYLTAARFFLWSRIIRTTTILPTLYNTDKRYATDDVFIAAPLFSETKRFMYMRNPKPYYYYRVFNGIWSSNLRNGDPEYIRNLCQTYHDALIYWVNYIHRQGKLTPKLLEVLSVSCELHTVAQRVRNVPPEHYEQCLSIFHSYFCNGNRVLADSDIIIYPDFVRRLETLIRKPPARPA